MQRIALIVASLALVTGFVPAVVAQSQAPVSETPVGPVFNPGFEVGPPETAAHESLEGSPADECVGVGHQVLYGSESPQGNATGGPYDSPNASAADPEAAAGQVQEDPEGEAAFAAGYGHCVWGPETGYDGAWIQPVDKAQQPAHWSYDVRDPAVEFGYGYDGDAMDREAQFEKDGAGSGHNLWQWFGSPHQAWTPNAEAVTLTIESLDEGTPSKGIVRLSLTPMPLEAQGVHVYHDCSLSISAQQFAGAADAEGVAEVSPVEGSFNNHTAVCDDLKARWDAADEAGDEDAKREILGSTRITQLSFWGWNRNDHHVVVDDVQILGATTPVEEAAKGNVAVNVTVADDLATPQDAPGVTDASPALMP